MDPKGLYSPVVTHHIRFWLPGIYVTPNRGQCYRYHTKTHAFAFVTAVPQGKSHRWISTRGDTRALSPPWDMLVLSPPGPVPFVESSILESSIHHSCTFSYFYYRRQELSPTAHFSYLCVIVTSTVHPCWLLCSRNRRPVWGIWAHREPLQ